MLGAGGARSSGGSVVLAEVHPFAVLVVVGDALGGRVQRPHPPLAVRAFGCGVGHRVGGSGRGRPQDVVGGQPGQELPVGPVLAEGLGAGRHLEAVEADGGVVGGRGEGHSPRELPSQLVAVAALVAASEAGRAALVANQARRVQGTHLDGPRVRVREGARAVVGDGQGQHHRLLVAGRGRRRPGRVALRGVRERAYVGVGGPRVHQRVAFGVGDSGSQAHCASAADDSVGAQCHGGRLVLSHRDRRRELGVADRVGDGQRQRHRLIRGLSGRGRPGGVGVGLIHESADIGAGGPRVRQPRLVVVGDVRREIHIVAAEHRARDPRSPSPSAPCRPARRPGS